MKLEDMDLDWRKWRVMVDAESFKISNIQGKKLPKENHKK